jgi:hypothetical protein
MSSRKSLKLVSSVNLAARVEGSRDGFASFVVVTTPPIRLFTAKPHLRKSQDFFKIKT